MKRSWETHNYLFDIGTNFPKRFSNQPRSPHSDCWFSTLERIRKDEAESKFSSLQWCINLWFCRVLRPPQNLTTLHSRIYRDETPIVCKMVRGNCTSSETRAIKKRITQMNIRPMWPEGDIFCFLGRSYLRIGSTKSGTDRMNTFWMVLRTLNEQNSQGYLMNHAAGDQSPRDTSRVLVYQGISCAMELNKDYLSKDE
jgi:hypothetical protein